MACGRWKAEAKEISGQELSDESCGVCSQLPPSIPVADDQAGATPCWLLLEGLGIAGAAGCKNDTLLLPVVWPDGLPRLPLLLAQPQMGQAVVSGVNHPYTDHYAKPCPSSLVDRDLPTHPSGGKSAVSSISQAEKLRARLVK